MKFVLNKQTGFFVLREDLTSGIKAAARDLVDLENKKLKTLEDVTRESEREYNNAKKTKEQKKTEYEQAYAFLQSFKEELTSFYFQGNKIFYNKYDKTKEVALFIEDQKNAKPTTEQVNNYLEELQKHLDNDRLKNNLENIKKALYKCADYSPNDEQIDEKELDEAIKNVQTMISAGALIPIVLGQPEIAPFVLFLYKALCVEPPAKFERVVPIYGETVDQILNLLKIFLSVDGIKRLIINSLPGVGTYNMVKSLYIVIKYRDQLPACKKSTEINSEEPTQQKEQPQQTKNNSNDKDLTDYKNREDFNIAGDRKAKADLERSLSTRNRRIDQARINTRRNKVNESKILKEYREEINNLLIPHMQKQLGFNHPPTINFAEDPENAQDMFGKTAYYNPSTSEITVYITNRHPKDIMRSVAHEIVHHAQNQRGEFENSFNLGEEGYAQNNSHLRSMEEEAYLSGNMIFRDWEDNFKKQRNQNKMINESSLRAKIRSLIKEEMYNHIENEPANKHDAGCGCKECDKKKRFLDDHGVKNIAESVEKEIMPLKEWRNMELNSLLLNRFGIVSPQVLGEKTMTPKEKELAAKYPPEDKITRGDVITAAKEKGGKSAKKPAKKGKVPPQFLKGKQDESK